MSLFSPRKCLYNNYPLKVKLYEHIKQKFYWLIIIILDPDQLFCNHKFSIKE